MPVIAAIGMDFADWPRETPPTKTMASRPSRNTTTNGSVKSAHFPVRALPVTSTRTINTRARDPSSDLTLALESTLKLDTPFSLCVVQLEHGDTHNKDQNCGNEFEYSCELKLKNRPINASIAESLPSQRSSDFLYRSEALVNQMTMNTVPIVTAMRKPIAEPRKI